MSISSKIEELTTARNAIRTKMITAGQATSNDKLSTLAVNLSISPGVTPTPITPSQSAPSMTANNAYEPTVDGYAIDNYTPIKPSEDNSGTYFPSGFVKMSSSGYAYENKPSGGGLTETLLWNNTDPTAAAGFSAKQITLSDDINNYDFICVEYAKSYSAQNDISKVYWRVSDLVDFRLTSGNKTGGLTWISTNNVINSRGIRYDSGTQIYFGNSMAAGSAANTWNIPLNVYGCK